MRAAASAYVKYENAIQRQPEIVYNSQTGVDLHLEIIRPMNVSGILPVIFWIHGGGWGWRGQRGSYRELMQIPLAAAGYCAIGIEYRLSAHERFPAQILDIKRAIQYVRNHSLELGVDPDRFGLWGRSAGGHLATLAGTSAGAPEFGVEDVSVHAVVSCFGPSDLSAILDGLVPEREAHIRMVTSTFLGGQIEDKPDLVQLANPISYLDGMHVSKRGSELPSFLFVHGLLDKSVPFSQSQMLHDRLIDVGTQSVLMGVEHANHGLLPYPDDAVISPSLEDIHLTIRDFFDRALGASELPDISMPHIPMDDL